MERYHGQLFIASSMKLGAGIDPSTQIGPLVSATQQKRVLGCIESGFAEGARAATGGTAGEGAGYFVKPTVLVETSDDMKVVREEIFGPVVVAMPFGGFKQSGIGREMGRAVLDPYTESKSVIMAL